MNNINVDHYMTIGSSHQVCEDYIISGTEPFPYIILSDGCSSSKDTDIGARILAQCAKNYLTTFHNLHEDCAKDTLGYKIIFWGVLLLISGIPIFIYIKLGERRIKKP